MVISKILGMKMMILSSVIVHYVHCFHINQNKYPHDTRSCVVCECCIYDKSIHSSLLSWRDSYLKNWNIKSKMIKAEVLMKKRITYTKHIKITSWHMEFMFIQKHLIRKRLQCAHILSMIMHFHTGNVYCGVVLTVHVSIFLTMKRIISIKKKHPQLGFTFITSLDVVLLMVEFHWNKIKYVTCVDKNLHHTNLQIYTPEKS